MQRKGLADYVKERTLDDARLDNSPAFILRHEGGRYIVHYTNIPGSNGSIVIVRGPEDSKDPRWYYGKVEGKRPGDEGFNLNDQRKFKNGVGKLITRKNRIAGEALEGLLIREIISSMF